MKIKNKTCVNSLWIADFLAEEDQECCECFGSCKVRVEDRTGYNFIFNKDEIEKLDEFESNLEKEKVKK